jgi:hypothetical protein
MMPKSVGMELINSVPFGVVHTFALATSRHVSNIYQTMITHCQGKASKAFAWGLGVLGRVAPRGERLQFRLHKLIVAIRTYSM